MNETEPIITLISGIVQTGAISFLVYMIIKGLKNEIKTLQENILTQNKTIETMNKRVEETEKIGNLYKQLITDFPKAIDDYQAVITKTKDMTIYELKNKVEEQVFTIEDLQKKATIGGDVIKQKVAGIGKLFLQPDNKDLLEFLQKIHETTDVLLDSLLKNESLDEFLKSLNQKINILEDIYITEIFSSDKMLMYKVKTAYSNLDGNIYMISFDNQIYINQQCLEFFREKYKMLR